MSQAKELASTEREFLERYKQSRWDYAHLARLVGQFLEWKVEDIFSKRRLPILHLVQHRGKSPESIKRNFAGGRYDQNSPDGVQDLAGARLIFYYEDDLIVFCSDKTRFRDWFGKYAADNLNRVVGQIEQGHRNRTVPGYDSFHFPVCVTPNTAFWLSLQEPDQRRLKDKFCEVQLRTLLRHAWAEAEHDLRYKIKRLGEFQYPEKQDRLLVQIASAVQTADSQLVEVKSAVMDLLGSLHDDVGSESSWTYQRFSSPKAFVVSSVAYDYEVLHLCPHGAGLQTSLTIEELPAMFHVDQAIKNAVGADHYKHELWETLKFDEAQFIASIQHDSLVVRVSDWDADRLVIRVQPANYSDQVVTNHKRALVKPVPGIPQRTVGSLAYDSAGQLLPFSASPMSNTLGVACVARVEGGRYWAVALRSQAVAFDPGAWGCSASGALEWTELGHWETRDFTGWFKGGMAREFEEELGYSPAAASFHYLAFGRELGRAGKPQIFFYLDAPDLTTGRLESLWRTYTSPRPEYQKLMFIDTEAALDLVSSDESRVHKHTGTGRISEELRMNLALALRYSGALND